MQWLMSEPISWGSEGSMMPSSFQNWHDALQQHPEEHGIEDTGVDVVDRDGE